MLIYQDIGTGTPIVFIHGLGSKKEAWEPQHKLASDYRLIIPDLRGHGETELEQGLSIKNFALDIIHLLDDLNIPSAFICGLSLGGIIAQEIYRQRSEKVRGLILANTTSYIPFLFSYNSILVSNHLLHLNKERLLTRIVENSLYDHNYIEEARSIFHLRDSYIQSAKAPIGINYYTLLPTIQRPILLIGSTHDKVTPLINLFTMRNFIKNSQTVLFKNTGHLSNIEKKELFNQAVSRFLSKVA
jgi:3-oxoadipate enol-lactonase